MRCVLERKGGFSVPTCGHGVSDINRMDRVKVDEVEVNRTTCHCTRRGRTNYSGKVSVARHGY